MEILMLTALGLFCFMFSLAVASVLDEIWR
jgi:hypothetical protein